MWYVSYKIIYKTNTANHICYIIDLVISNNKNDLFLNRHVEKNERKSTSVNPQRNCGPRDGMFSE